MSNIIDDVMVLIRGDDTGATQAIDRTDKRMATFSQNANKLSGMVAGVGASLATGFGLASAGLVGMGEHFAKLADEEERIIINLSSFVGGMEKARDLFATFDKFETGTAIDENMWAEATKSMMIWGYSAEQAVPFVRMLGEFSEGSGEKMVGLANIMGRMSSRGTMDMRSLLMMSRSGIPIMGALSEQFNTSEEGVRKLVSEGKVGFADVVKAMQKMTGEGGAFHDRLAFLANNTFTGQLGKFSNLLGDIGKNIGRVILPPLITVMQWVNMGLERIKNAPPMFWKIVTVAGGIALAIGTAVTALAGFLGTIGGIALIIPLVVEGFAIFGGLLTGLVSALPIILAIGAGIAVVGLAVWGLVESFGGLGEIWKRISGWWESLGGTMEERIKNLIRIVAGFIFGAIDGFFYMRGIVVGVWNYIKEAGILAFQSLMQVGTGMVLSILKGVDLMVDGFVYMFNGIIKGYNAVAELIGKNPIQLIQRDESNDIIKGVLGDYQTAFDERNASMQEGMIRLFSGAPMTEAIDSAMKQSEGLTGWMNDQLEKLLGFSFGAKGEEGKVGVGGANPFSPDRTKDAEAKLSAMATRGSVDAYKILTATDKINLKIEKNTDKTAKNTEKTAQAIERMSDMMSDMGTEEVGIAL